MKKRFGVSLAVVLALSVALAAAFTLTACGKDDSLKSLRIEGAVTEFRIGDEFTYGDDFKVYAVYGNGTETDVTEEAQIRHEASFDMNVPGNYQITVSWGGKKEIYTVYVSDFENVLKKIEVVTDNVKTSFNLGDTVDFTGAKLKLTHENAQGKLVHSEATGLRGYDVTVVNENGHAVTDVFDKLGTYTVTVSKNGVKGTFIVDVNSVNISSVQGALAAGIAFSGNVVSGTHLAKGKKNGKAYDEYYYEYEFGKDHTYIKETIEVKEGAEWYCSMANGEFEYVYLAGGQMQLNSAVSSEWVYGTPHFLFYAGMERCGVESALSYLYDQGKICTNNDFVQEVDEATRTYSFSYSGLYMWSNTHHYFENRATFTLGEDYAITYAEYEQDCWQDNTNNSHGNPPIFNTDKNTGITTPVDKEGYSIRNIAIVNQKSGERTKTNPYSGDALKFKSYDLKIGNESYTDDDITVNCDIGAIKLEIVNSQPSTAAFQKDPMYFDYTGNVGEKIDATVFLGCNWFIGSRSGNDLNLNMKLGGVWKLQLITENITKTITFNVTGAAPTTMTSQICNTATGRFSNGSQKTVAIGGSVYFRGKVNDYANEIQEAEVTSVNGSTARVEEATVGGEKCFKFTATAAGTYRITVASSVAVGVQCSFTFTVSDLPDYEDLLNGKYTVTDRLGNIFELEFSPENTSGETNGKLKITKTPTEEDGTLITSKRESKTVDYAVDENDFSIVLTGDRFGIDLKVNVSGALVLEDQYGTEYTLIRVNE